MAAENPDFEFNEERLEELLESHKTTLRNADVDIIHKACKGIGTNDKLLINALCSRSKQELNEIDALYREAHEKSLLGLVKSECGGDYKDFLAAVVQPKDEWDRNLIRKATEGMGTNETVLIEVLVGRTPDEIHAMKEKYDAKYEKGLYDMLRSELGGDLEDALLTLAKEPREDGNPEEVDEDKAKEDANELHEAAKGWGANKKKMLEILVSQSRAQVQAIKAAYEAEFDSSLQSMLKKELSGDFEHCMVSLLWPNKYEMLAYVLHKAMDGLGTDHDPIIRILGGAEKDDCRLISEAYFAKYDRRLVDDIKKELRGNLRRAVIAWLTLQDPSGLASGVEHSKVEEAAALGKAIAERDADHVYLACKGFGTNEDALVDVLARRNKAQLQRVDNAFHAKYGRSLSKQIRKECGGDFKAVLRYITMPTYVFHTYMLKKAVKGLGTNEQLLIDILATCSNDELFQAKEHFERNTSGALIDRLRGEVSGGLDEYVVKRLKCDRSENPEVDEDAVGEQVEALAGMESSEEVIELLGSASIAQVQAIKAAFEEANSQSLAANMADKFSGWTEKAILSLLEDPVDHHCVRLHDAFEGMGSDESLIARTIGGSDKKLIARIAERYMEKYDVRLQDALKRELSAAFEDACVAWVTEPEHTGGLEDCVITVEHNEEAPVVDSEDEGEEEEPEEEEAEEEEEEEAEEEPEEEPATETVSVDRSGEDRVMHRGGTTRASNVFPARKYVGLTVTCQAISSVKVSCSATDQGWGGEGSSFMELVLLDRHGHLKAAHRVGTVSHEEQEFELEIEGDEFVEQASFRDSIQLLMVSAPWPGWACKCFSAHLEYTPAE